MKITKCLVFLLVFLPVLAFSGQISDVSANKIVDSIYKIEGGAKTKYPFGIKSINTYGNYEVARRICLNTIRNNYFRWQKTPKTNDFLQFLQTRYCPIGAKDDPKNLNSNWLSNLRKTLGKEFKITEK